MNKVKIKLFIIFASENVKPAALSFFGVLFKILKHVKQIFLLCNVSFRYNLKVRYFIIFKYWF